MCCKRIRKAYFCNNITFFDQCKIKLILSSWSDIEAWHFVHPESRDWEAERGRRRGGSQKSVQNNQQIISIYWMTAWVENKWRKKTNQCLSSLLLLIAHRHTDGFRLNYLLYSTVGGKKNHNCIVWKRKKRDRQSGGIYTSRLLPASESEVDVKLCLSWNTRLMQYQSLLLFISTRLFNISWHICSIPLTE